MNHPSSIEHEWIFDTAAIETLLTKLCFRENVIGYVCEAARQVSHSEDTTEFLSFCKSWQGKVKQQPMQECSSQWQTLAVISAFPETIKNHRARGVPWEITVATLLDFQRRLDENQARQGKWQFHNLGWMSNHVSGRFFEIGRLQYILATFGYPFRVYRDSNTNEVVALALKEVKCTTDGWRQDDADGFTTHLEERTDGIIGHPVSPKDGSVASTPITIAPDSQVLLDDHSEIVQIHIPWGGKLTHESCVDSLKEAKTFFEKYFSSISVQAFCTGTWLIDPELRKVLLPTSNIVAFGNLFRPLASRNGNDHQLIERVFNKKLWKDCVAENSLQKAVLEHHQNGGQFRHTSGYILPEDIERL